MEGALNSELQRASRSGDVLWMSDMFCCVSIHYSHCILQACLSQMLLLVLSQNKCFKEHAHIPLCRYKGWETA